MDNESNNRAADTDGDRNQDLIPVFIPALAALLHRAEELKGAPLVEEEVLLIRDKGVCMMLEEEAANLLAARRGYKDIDPENCWNEWQQLKAQFERTEE